jgi:orotate phosphoribosyltransferase
MNSKSVILCDDLLAGGGHMWRCIERLDNEGASCVGAVVILDNDAVINRDKVDLVKQRLKERLISIISVRQK